MARVDAGFVVLDREAGEFFLRSRSFTFPGMKIAEIFGIDDGPLYDEIRRKHRTSTAPTTAGCAAS